MTQASAQIHYANLGMFRFILALTVFAHHVSTFVFDANPYRIAGGSLGVMLFFTVSGYVVFSAHDQFYTGRLFSFAINRILKIYPLFYFFSAASITIMLFLPDHTMGEWRIPDFTIKRVIAFVSIIGSYLDTNAIDMLRVAWTLQIELAFYAIAFGIFYHIDRTEYKKEWLSAYFVVACLGYVAVVMSGTQYRWWGSYRYAPFFILGACLYFGSKPGSTILPKIGMLVSFLLSVSWWYDSVDSGSASPTLDAIIYCTYSAVLLILVHGVRVPWGVKIDRLLGDATYALYLVHMIVIYFFLWIGIPKTLLWNIILGLISIALAYGAHRVVERPLFRLRDRFRGGQLV